MRTYVEIEADTNDGDYVSERTAITVEDLDLLKVIISKLGSGRISWHTNDQVYGDNDPEVMYKDILTEEEIEFLNDICPRSEYGIHTIEDIVILEISNEYKLN